MTVKEWIPEFFEGIGQGTLAGVLLKDVIEMQVDSKAQAYTEIDARLRSTRILISNLDYRLRKVER